MTQLNFLVRKPGREHGKTVYSNLNHVLDQDVVRKLAHDHGMYAIHTSKLFCGYVFAYIDPWYSRLLWANEVWVRYRHISTLIGIDIESVITKAIEEYGYA